MAPTDASPPRSLARRLIQALDEAWCRASLAAFGDRPGLLAFMFHAVAFDDQLAEMDRVVSPAQTIAQRSLDAFISYFLRAGYQFVSPQDMRGGLRRNGRFVLLTFDDGYSNNLRVLPVLHRHQVPATFFIAAGHVASGHAFWWDVIYRERLRLGAHRNLILAEQRDLKRLTHVQVEEYISREFGMGALQPAGDDDRPLNERELEELARDPFAHIGNHTRDHAILTNYSIGAAERQIYEAQEMLESICGRRPIIIAYPNGNYSPEVLCSAKRCGLELGVTVRPRRGAVPMTQAERMTIARFAFTRGNDNLRTYVTFRSRTSVRRTVSSLRKEGLASFAK